MLYITKCFLIRQPRFTSLHFHDRTQAYENNVIGVLPQDGALPHVTLQLKLYVQRSTCDRYRLHRHFLRTLMTFQKQWLFMKTPHHNNTTICTQLFVQRKTISCTFLCIVCLPNCRLQLQIEYKTIGHPMNNLHYVPYNTGYLEYRFKLQLPKQPQKRHFQEIMIALVLLYLAS